MATFGRASTRRLLSCHRDLIAVMHGVIQVHPLDFTIVCGHRGQADQDQAVADGFSRKPWPTSKHNTTPSIAVDIAPYSSLIHDIDWKDRIGFCLLAGAVLGVAHELGVRLRWGGNWRGEWPLPRASTHPDYFYDLPHFELVQP